MYGSLKAIDKSKANAMRLQGKVFVGPYDDKNCKGCYMANIHLVGIQKIDSPDKVVGFIESIISSFLFKQSADIKNISLPAFGDEQDLKRAIQDLEQGKIHTEDLKRVRKFKAAHSKQDKNARWLVDKGKTRKLLTAVNAGELKAVEPSEYLKTALNDGDLSNNARTSKESSHASSGHDAVRFNLNQDANGYGNLPGFQSIGSAVPKKTNENNKLDNENVKKPYKNAKDYDLYLLDRIDQKT